MGKHQRIFPEKKDKNLVLITSGIGAKKDFSVFASSRTPDLNILEAGSQCYPLNLSQTVSDKGADLLTETFSNFESNINYFPGFDKFDRPISEAIFFYIYALFHHKDFISLYRNDLLKKSPRMYVVKNVDSCKKFIDSGASLVNLHVGYQTQPPYLVNIVFSNDNLFDQDRSPALYRVKKMRFGGTRGREDKTTVIYNEHITIKNIPLEAYELRCEWQTCA